MRRNILFVIEGLDIGGAEKSLLALLASIDYELYNVDLFVFKNNGKLIKQIPTNVNLLPVSKEYMIFSKNRKLAPLNLLRFGYVKKSVYIGKYLIGCFISKVMKQPLYIGWENVKYLLPIIEKKYDVAISYLERKCMYFTADNVSATKKIAFIHNNYNKYPFDYKLDQYYMKYYDLIPTVSDNCQNVLMKIFPEYSEKFIVIKNMIPEDMIKEMANEKIELWDKMKKETVIVTVGRIVPQKGFDIAIEICKQLVNLGVDIKWYIFGESTQNDKYTMELIQKINRYELQNRFILYGATLNPYKYIDKCDIYVQPSRFEGYGITVAEAKILKKPIVTSDIPEFKEQIENGKTGYLCDKIDEYVKIINMLICNKNAREKLIHNLEGDSHVNNTVQMKNINEFLLS